MIMTRLRLLPLAAAVEGGMGLRQMLRTARATAPLQVAALLLICGFAGCDSGGGDDGGAAADQASEVSGRAADAVTYGEALSADGVVIRYEVRGTVDPTLMLVHGWANTRGIWGEHPKTLAQSHRVVALDLAGHGESGADRSDWSMGAFGDDITAVADQLGLERVVLVGFSMGGAAVLEAAKRLGDRVLGVVFVDVFKDPDIPLSDAEAQQLEAAMRANWRDPAFIRAFAFKPDAPDSLIDYVLQTMPEQPHEYWFTVLHSMRDWMQSDFLLTLQAIDSPIAAINSAEPPTNVEAMRRYAPSFTVDTIAGVGHGGILLRRVDDFDRRLLAIVERFGAGA